ncbi:hypothetical protein TrLO_g5649 [Triparma laevis f. longispina]|uniref:Uncharacterized protein n=1 Tax=Triparma laevis f. longispina TaxID=1714387 RepID=A0A9W7CC40_9STRA|nr:hypothetical protein TrLO_g5649 [Triparma laevis f. longispina]
MSESEVLESAPLPFTGNSSSGNGNAGDDVSMKDPNLVESSMNPQQAFEVFSGKVIKSSPSLKKWKRISNAFTSSALKAAAMKESISHLKDSTQKQENYGSILSRLERIQRDADTIDADIKQLTSKSPHVTGTTTTELTKLATLIKSQLDESTTKIKGLNDDATLRMLKNDIAKQRERLEKSHVANSGKDRKGGQERDIVYEFYGRGGKFKKGEGLWGIMEERIVRLENECDLGGSNASLKTRMDTITKTLQRLDPMSVKQSLSLLKVLRSELEATQKLTQGSAANDQKITSLHTQMESVLEMREQLPKIVQRLTDLKVLHGEAASFENRLGEVERGVEEASALLGSLEGSIEQVEIGVKEGIEEMAKNAQNVQERIAKMTKKDDR